MGVLYGIWQAVRPLHLAWSAWGAVAAAVGCLFWASAYLLVFLFRGAIDRHVARKAGLYGVARVSPSSVFWDGPLK